MQQINSAQGFQTAGILETNKVIRNTYILLAMTVLFSAATAMVSTVFHFAMPFWLNIVGMFGLLYLTHLTANSAMGIVCVFGFTGFMGLTLGPMMNMYLTNFTNGGELIAASLGATGAIFFALSGYAMTTRKDFSYLGGFLFVGFTVAILASLAAMFFQVPALHLAISCVIVLLSAGYILFETSRMIHGGERNYIRATVSIYLDLFNMFVNLLHIFAALAGNRD